MTVCDHSNHPLPPSAQTMTLEEMKELFDRKGDRNYHRELFDADGHLKQY